MANPNEDPIKGLISFLVAHLVDEPEHVEVTEVPGETAVTYEIRVAPNDLGKVIGKQGRIANALRTVAKASGMRDQRKVFVDIIA
jgi:predicted RNA-binding protein YlqC (UPF0109 family)